MSNVSRRGFSLPELLVVIGIISILIGILLPTVTSARRQAKSLACMSNMREIVRGCMLHAAEHDGYFPLAGQIRVPTDPNVRPDRIARGLGDPSRRRYVYALAPENNNSWYVVPWQASLAPYLAKSQPIPTENWRLIERSMNSNTGVWKSFMCPETESFARGTRTIGTETYPLDQGTVISVMQDMDVIYIWSTNGDYVLNEGVLGYDYANVVRRLRGASMKIKDPTRTMLLTDGQPRKELPEPGEFPGFRDGWQVWSPRNPTGAGLVTFDRAVPLSDAFNPISPATSIQNFDMPRHRGKINIAFADGHVETRWASAKDLTDVWILPPP